MPGARYAAVVVVIAMTGMPSLVPRSVTAALYRSPDTTVQLAQLAPTEVPVPGASSLTAISCVSPSDCFVSGTAGPLRAGRPALQTPKGVPAGRDLRRRGAQACRPPSWSLSMTSLSRGSTRQKPPISMPLSSSAPPGATVVTSNRDPSKAHRFRSTCARWCLKRTGGSSRKSSSVNVVRQVTDEPCGGHAERLADDFGVKDRYQVDDACRAEPFWGRASRVEHVAKVGGRGRCGPCLGLGGHYQVRVVGGEGGTVGEAAPHDRQAHRVQWDRSARRPTRREHRASSTSSARRPRSSELDNACNSASMPTRASLG